MSSSNTIILNGETTAERCPSCGEWCIVRHGTREDHATDAHLVDCPVCGENRIVNVLYQCMWCSGFSEEWPVETQALYSLTERLKAMSGFYDISHLGDLIDNLAPSEGWKEQAWRTAGAVLWKNPGVIFVKGELEELRRQKDL